MEEIAAKRLQSRQSSRVLTSAVNDLSQALSFDKQTVKVLAPQLLPFDEADVPAMYAPPKSLVRTVKAKPMYSSLPSAGFAQRHSTCKFDYGIQDNAFDIKKNLEKLRDNTTKRPATVSSSATFSLEPQPTEDSMKQRTRSVSRMSTNLQRPKTRDDVVENVEWSEYMLTLVSANTAKWIVVKRTKPGEFRNRLVKFLEGHYDTSLQRDLKFGEDEYGGVELIYDTPPKDEDDDALVLQLEADRLARQAELEMAAEAERNRVPDRRSMVKLPEVDSAAKQKHSKCRHLTDNYRAYQAEEYKTDYIDAMLTNQQPITPRGNYLNDRSSVIQYGKTRNDLIKYKKNQQSVFPRPTSRWKTHKRGEVDEMVPDEDKMRVTRGFRRWTALPTEVDEAGKYLIHPGAAAQRTFITDENESPTRSKTAAFRVGRGKSTEDGAELKKQKTLLGIVEEWRSLWHLSRCFTETTWKELENELLSPDRLVKLRAILSCSRAKRVSQYSEINSPMKVSKGLLPERILEILTSFLTDEKLDLQLKRAVAICLFTLEYQVEDARKIIFDMLDDASHIDRHAAALCLAANGIHDARIIAEIIDRYLMTKNALERQQSVNILVALSRHSKLVGGLLAEQMNNINWRDRLLICDILPALHGHISRDIVQKLVNLMWLDWHRSVRYAAARALGRTGNGKAVHNDLCDKLQMLDTAKKHLIEFPQVRSTISANSSPCLDADVTTTMQVDALHKLRYLGLMTAKLYNLLLPLFEDPHIRIRAALCALCGSLKISDELVGRKLVNLVRYDSSMNVKALAIAALRSIGRVDESLASSLIWSFRYETDAIVRIEACRAMIQLSLLEREDVKQALLDRHLLEKDPKVHRAIEIAMTRIGLRLDAEIETASKIRQEVQRLCTKTRISALILQNEAQSLQDSNAKRLLRNPISSVETQKAIREERSKRVWEDLKLKIERLNQKFAGTNETEAGADGDADADADGEADAEETAAAAERRVQIGKFVAEQAEMTAQGVIEQESPVGPSRSITRSILRQSTFSAIDEDAGAGTGAGTSTATGANTIDNDRAPSQSIESARSNDSDDEEGAEMTKSPYSSARQSVGSSEPAVPDADVASRLAEANVLQDASTIASRPVAPFSAKTTSSKKQVSFTEAQTQPKAASPAAEDKQMASTVLSTDPDAFVNQREAERTSSSRMEVEEATEYDSETLRLPTTGRELLAKLKEKEDLLTEEEVTRKPTLSISPWILEELLALESLDEIDLSKFSSKDFASVAKLLHRLDFVESSD